ncbi:MAG: M13 family metallopeptidase [Bacteroidales bacterium]|nr:M13 family metallopeptidase [Bacteroidales bacterium]
MKFKSLIIISIVAYFLNVACTSNEEKIKAIDPSDMDLTIKPGNDFDNYANGGWKTKHTIPDDKSRYGSFDQLAETGEEQVKVLMEELASIKHEKGSVAQKVADFYALGMDTVKLEQQGISPLQPYLDKINQISTIDEIQQTIASFHALGLSPLFNFYSAADEKNSEMVITYLAQGGLGMPDRDYYTKDDERSLTIQSAYLNYIEKTFALMGEPDAKVKAQEVMKLETRLAKASMTRLEQRDPYKTYHKMDVKGFSAIAPAYDWNTYFETIKLKNPGDVIVSQPDFFTEASAMMKEVSVDTWKTYLKWDLVNSLSNYLSPDFEQLSFDFYGKELSGQIVQRPRWKRVLGTTNRALSEAIGQMYVEKYFPPEAKERMITLVQNLKISLGERIQDLDWMGDTTKVKAIEKLDAMRVKVGYPDKWRNYSALAVDTDAYVLNVLRARSFAFDFDVSKINKPVDKDEWFMPPQMVNAYYNPTMNEIVFPAAILQPPFFYLTGDDAVNYGAIGVVIGHEMSHGFDDQGRNYDKEGNLTDWWTSEDAERFNQRTAVLVDQFNQYVVLDTLRANGKLTLGENIADLGGLNISYQAYKNATSGKQEPSLDGFTPDQRFYLAYAHVWAQNIRDKEILRRTNDDVHSLGHLRVIGPLKNIPEFYAAFDIKEGDPMYLPEDQRAKIW